MVAARHAFESGDYRTALEIWGPLAHAGVSEAQAYVGTCFVEGWGVDQDFALAVRWLTLAADAEIRTGNAIWPHFISEAMASRKISDVLRACIAGPPRPGMDRHRTC
jgi:TPR repeat protein